MERGLLWLPLLAVFFGLAWMGWNEYRKIEAYSLWAEQFEQAKYDIYAVLGQRDKQLTWGKPSRSGPLELQSFSLDDVQEIRLLVKGQPVDLESPQGKGAIALEFTQSPAASSIQIPFTDLDLAAKWGRYLLQVKSKK